MLTFTRWPPVSTSDVMAASDAADAGGSVAKASTTAVSLNIDTAFAIVSVFVFVFVFVFRLVDAAETLVMGTPSIETDLIPELRNPDTEM